MQLGNPADPCAVLRRQWRSNRTDPGTFGLCTADGFTGSFDATAERASGLLMRFEIVGGAVLFCRATLDPRQSGKSAAALRCAIMIVPSLWIVFAVVVGIYAGNRGRFGPGWVFLALMLSPLVGVLSACAVVSWPTVNLAPDCPYDDSSFNRHDLGMQLPKDACPSPQR